MNDGRHLHLCQGELHVVLVLGHIAHEGGFVFDLIEALDHACDLLLRLGRAVSGGTAQALVHGSEVSDTIGDVVVVSLHDRVG